MALEYATFVTSDLNKSGRVTATTLHSIPRIMSLKALQTEGWQVISSHMGSPPSAVDPIITFLLKRET